MGVVYKARDTKLDRLVALKFLPPPLTTSEEAKTRFIQEARAASMLDHPNIAVIHEIGETEAGQLFIAMAYYEGETLKEKIARGPLPPSEALGYAVQVAEGLARAHEAGIVHRDVKPANIIVTRRGVVKLVDFGLAKMTGEATLTRTGTVAYMSPEQTRGALLDGRTDLWSLGVVLYEMLTGERPFRGAFNEVVIYGIRHDEPASVATRCPETPMSLVRVVDCLLEKKREARYASAAELLVALKTGHTRLQPSDTTRRAKPVSMVLLPLLSMAREAEQEWFTDSMTDALITDLAKISGLRIISRASAMHYKDTDKTPRDIAAELGVDYIVEGSIAKAGEQVKISATKGHGTCVGAGREPGRGATG